MVSIKQKGPYAAEIGVDPELETTVITLSYEDQAHPAHSLLIAIAPELGSNLFRFRAGDQEIIYCDRELLKQKGFTANFVLWPLPNRVRDCQYSYEGKHYSLKQFKQEARPAGDDVLIHGLVFDRAWQYETPVVGPDAASVTTFIDITPQSPYFEAYPFVSRLSLTYTLNNNGVTITYHVKNNGDQKLPFGFALHPYFSTLSTRKRTLVNIPAEVVMEADNKLLPTGRLLDVSSVMYGMFDLRQPVPVSTLKLDHVYTKVDSNEPTVIDYPDQNLQLRITTTSDFTHVVIYTLGDGPFLCVEHQTCSTDAINLHQQGEQERAMAHLLEVEPGATQSGSLLYTVHFLE